MFCLFTRWQIAVTKRESTLLEKLEENATDIYKMLMLVYGGNKKWNADSWVRYVISRWKRWQKILPGNNYKQCLKCEKVNEIVWNISKVW